MKRSKYIINILAVMAAFAAILMISSFAFAAEDDDLGDNTTAAAQAEEYQELSSSRSEKPNMVRVVLISLGISVVVTGLTVHSIYRGYKYNGQTEPYQYSKKAPLQLTLAEDELIDTQVTKRRIERRNN
ncbi:MAG: hypothetical protein IJ192_00155 [Clostridia bacterium]|nr:hypothetical protein [Clostridia bacterium]MBR2176348.1 hypothetical protein [Clostridia bacterium]